jgi:hypothetical protein
MFRHYKYIDQIETARRLKHTITIVYRLDKAMLLILRLRR